MAAIIEPRSSELCGPRRPALRLVTTDGRSSSSATVTVPVDLGLRPAHLVVALVAFAAVLVGTWAMTSGALSALAPAPPSAAATAGGASAATAAEVATVQAEAGDSLWSIARRLQPTGDVRPLVDELVALNGAGPIQPGDRVVVPG